MCLFLFVKNNNNNSFFQYSLVATIITFKSIIFHYLLKNECYDLSGVFDSLKLIACDVWVFFYLQIHNTFFLHQLFFIQSIRLIRDCIGHLKLLLLSIVSAEKLYFAAKM